MPYSCSELAEALKSIQSMIQCYSCHKPLHSARTCINGHGICWNCKNRLNKICPVCKSMILEAKSVMLNDLIKLLPRQCKFTPKGCDSLVLANDMDHEQFCKFRHTMCRIRNCEWKGMVKDLLLHLERFHGKEIIRSDSHTAILMSFNTNINREGLTVIVAYNTIFWQHVRVRNNRLMQFYQYVPVGRPTQKFSVLVSFHTPEAQYTNTTPAHTDVFDISQLFHDRETFCLPKKVANSFNRFHSGVHYSFKITQWTI